MIANDLRLDMRWIDTEVPAEMNAKPLAIEKGAGAKHGCARTDLPRHIGEGIGRIGDDEENGIRCGRHDLGNDVAINFGVLSEQLEPTLWIGTIGRATGFFINTSGHQNDAGAGKRVIVAIHNVDFASRAGCHSEYRSLPPRRFCACG